MKTIGWLLCSLFVLSASADSTNFDFHDYIIQHYDFQPHLLSDAERTKKSAGMDEVWELVKSKPDLYLPLLRKELASTNAPSFFYYDGSELLLSLSKAKEDKRIVSQAVARSAVVDVRYENYFYTVYRLALDGEDAVDAAFNILSEDKFRVIVPQHALTLGQDYCFIYLLSQSDDTNYFGKVVARLKTEKSPEAQKTLLMCLWYTVTKEGLAEVENFAADKSKDASSKKFAKERLELVRDWQKHTSAPKESYDSLKSKRKKVMRRVSDEALIEYDQITARMFAKMK